MIMFKEFVDAFNKNCLISAGNVDWLAGYIKDAKIFVMHPSLVKSNEFNVDELDRAEIDLPFKTCWFEMLPNSDGTRKIASGSHNFDGEEIRVGILGILVHEKSPRVYDIALYQVMSGHRSVIHGSDMYGGNKQICYYNDISQDDGQGVIGSVNGFIELLKNRVSFGTESTREALKVQENGSREFHRVRKIIHVYPRKIVERAENLPAYVNWTHRWLVMGHWRKLHTQGLGKDREGSYSVAGFTWVVDHEKGPSHLPPVFDKTRLVKGEVISGGNS